MATIKEIMEQNVTNLEQQLVVERQKLQAAELTLGEWFHAEESKVKELFEFVKDKFNY